MKKTLIILFRSFIIAAFILVPVSYSFFAGTCQASISKTDSLENLLQTVKEDSIRVKILNILCQDFGNKNPKKAIEYGVEALEISEQLKNSSNEIFAQWGKRGIASSLGVLGIIYKNQGNYKKALDYSLRSLKIREEFGDKKGIAQCLNNIGIICYFQGDFEKTIDYFLQALKILKELGDRRGMAGGLGNIGIIYKKQGDYVSAIKYHMQCLKILEELGDNQGIASGLDNLGAVYDVQGKFEKAVNYFFRSLKIREEIGDKKGTVNSLLNIGGLYKNQGYYDKAIEYYERSLLIAKQLGVQDNIKNIYGNLAMAYSKKNNYKKAFEFHQLCTKLKDSLYNDESSKQMAEMQVKYESEKKKRQIVIQNLKLGQQALELNRNKILQYALIGGLLMLLLLSFVVYNRYRIKKKANMQLEAAYNVIEEKSKDITDSIIYASNIQQAILPSESEMKNDLPEHFVYFVPKDIVSGDFYWFYKAPPLPIVPIAAGRVGEGLYIAACDCTGHGVPGAFVSMIGNDLLNQIIIEKNINDPGKILSLLNKGVKSVFTRKGEQEAQDGMDMALCKLFDNGFITIEFSGANNPMFILRRDGGQGPEDEKQEVRELNKPSHILTEIKGDKTAIGGRTDINYNFTTHKIELQKGDSIYIFTDGYFDQFGGSDNKKFMKRRFKDLLLSIQDKSMDEQKEILHKTFEDWKSGKEQIDDILVIGIRV